MAIIYLQCDRLKDLLDNLTKNKFIKFLESQKENIMYGIFKKIDIENGIVEIGESMPSNYLRFVNQKFYDKIDKILISKLSDID